MDKKTVLGLIGVLIADHPLRVKLLLARFGFSTSKHPGERELISKIMLAIEKGSSSFHGALAKLITKLVINRQEDAFADPLSAVAGAIGSIAGLFGNAQKRKLAKEEARSKTLSTLLAYKAQKEQAMASAASKAQAHKHKMALVKTLGFIVVAALLGWLLFKQHNQNPIQKKENYEHLSR